MKSLRARFWVVMVTAAGVAAMANADERVELKDGRMAVLHADGTWELAPLKASGEPLELVEVEKRLLPQDFEAGRLSANVCLTLTLRNPDARPVIAWRGTMAVVGPFGDVLLKGKLESGSRTIPPGETNDFDFCWEDNQFIEDQPFDKLAGNMAKNLRYTLTEIQVVTE